MNRQLIVTLSTFCNSEPITPEQHEIVEDAIADTLHLLGISAVVENDITGNTTTTDEFHEAAFNKMMAGYPTRQGESQ